MKNTVNSFQLFVRPDEKSMHIANNIRKLNLKSANPLAESDDGDLIIAIGGDGTFIDAVTSTNFSKKKIYTGIHTGTLGFMQDMSDHDILSLIQYLHFESELRVRKVYVSCIKVFLKDGGVETFYSLNEILVGGKDYSKISFAEYINGELFQNVSGNGIVIAGSTGDTAYSMNAGGAIDFSHNFQLVCTLVTPIKNAAFERFITNPVICSEIRLEMKPAGNISIIVDGRKKDIDSNLIESIEVSMTDNSNYINKLDLMNYSKVRVVREKILGY